MQNNEASTPGRGSVRIADTERFYQLHLQGRGAALLLDHLEEGDEALRRAISESLGVAARLAVRIPIRLEVGIEAERFHRFCETRNISSSGVLISTSRPLSVGMRFNFELTLPYTLGPVTGIAKAVRHTDPEHEGTTGFGSTFLSLNDGDEERIQSFIRSQLPRN